MPIQPFDAVVESVLNKIPPLLVVSGLDECCVTTCWVDKALKNGCNSWKDVKVLILKSDADRSSRSTVDNSLY